MWIVLVKFQEKSKMRNIQSYRADGAAFNELLTSLSWNLIENLLFLNSFSWFAWVIKCSMCHPEQRAPFVWDGVAGYVNQANVKAAGAENGRSCSSFIRPTRGRRGRRLCTLKRNPAQLLWFSPVRGSREWVCVWPALSVRWGPSSCPSCSPQAPLWHWDRTPASPPATVWEKYEEFYYLPPWAHKF